MWRVRRTVVLLHGFTHTGRSWDPVVARLGERYRALAPDIRGHGAAAGARPVGPAECAADVAAAAPERFVLAGYSMGGRLALHVALSVPARVEALVLVAATPGLADPVEREARAREDAALAERIEASTIEEFAERWGRNPLFKGQPPERGRGGARRPPTQRHGGPGRGAARPRSGNVGADVGTAGRAADARGPRGRRTRRQVPEARASAWPPRFHTPRCSSSPPSGTRSISRRPGSSPRRSCRPHRHGSRRVEASRAPRPASPARAGRRGQRPERRLAAGDDPGHPGPNGGAHRLPARRTADDLLLRRHHAPVGAAATDRRGRGGRDHPVRGQRRLARASSGDPARPPGDPAPRRGARPAPRDDRPGGRAREAPERRPVALARRAGTHRQRRSGPSRRPRHRGQPARRGRQRQPGAGRRRRPARHVPGADRAPRTPRIPPASRPWRWPSSEDSRNAGWRRP